MLGHRGCRLGSHSRNIRNAGYGYIPAACQLTKEGVKVIPEIMIPLVGIVRIYGQKDVVNALSNDE